MDMVSRLLVHMQMISSCCHWRVGRLWPGLKMVLVNFFPTHVSPQTHVTQMVTNNQLMAVSSLQRWTCLETWYFINNQDTWPQTRVMSHVSTLTIPSCHNLPSPGSITDETRRNPRKSLGCFIIVTYVTKDLKTNTVSTSTCGHTRAKNPFLANFVENVFDRKLIWPSINKRMHLSNREVVRARLNHHHQA